MHMNRGVLIFAGLVAFYTVEPASAGWELEKKTDPLTDKVIATATSSYLEGTTRRAAIVRCTGLQLEVLFVFGEFLGDGNVLIKYRADRLPPVDASWLPSANGTAVFADNDADIARMLAKGTSFIIEAMDFRGQPHRSTFDLNGAAQPI